MSGNITQLYKVDEVLDDELILSEKNILAITGLVYPINSKKAEKFIVKPFAHFGIGTDFSSLCTVLGGGVSFSFKHNDVESMDYEIVYNYQLSGTNAGLWNLTFGANILGYFGIGIGIISAFT